MPGHDIDGEDSTEERCPVAPVSFVVLRFGLSFGKHVEDAVLAAFSPAHASLTEARQELPNGASAKQKVPLRHLLPLQRY